MSVDLWTEILKEPNTILLACNDTNIYVDLFLSSPGWFCLPIDHSIIEECPKRHRTNTNNLIRSRIRKDMRSMYKSWQKECSVPIIGVVIYNIYDRYIIHRIRDTIIETKMTKNNKEDAKPILPEHTRIVIVTSNYIAQSMCTC